MNILSIALKLLTSEWRSTHLRLMLAALTLAITCITSLSFFTDRINRALDEQSGELLGADLILSSSNPIEAIWQNSAHKLKLNTSESYIFPSVLVSANHLQLATIKAVRNPYPLRGFLHITTKPNSPERLLQQAPSVGTIWVEPRLLNQLQVQIGDFIKLGSAQFKITHLLTFQPDSDAIWSTIAPSVIININDVAKAKIIQPGSRIEYRLLLSGNPESIHQFRAMIQPNLAANQRLVTAADARPALKSTLLNATRYLHLAGLISVILAGVAIAMAAYRYCEQHYDSSALLKCFGFTQLQILSIFGFQLFMLTLFGIIAGSLLGLLLQLLFDHLFIQIITIQLPNINSKPIVSASCYGLLLMFSFAALPFINLKNITPIRIIQRNWNQVTTTPIAGMLIPPFAIMIIMWWQTHDIKLTLVICSGILLLIIISWIGTHLLLSSIKFTTNFAPHSWHNGLNNLVRHANLSWLQIIAFSLTLMVMILLGIMRNDLLTDWRNQLPKTAANYFAINIMPNEVNSIKRFLQLHHLQTNDLYPMVRGRLTNINDVPIQQAVPEKARNHNVLRRDLNLSWQKTLPDDNQIVAGTWWQTTRLNHVEISVEQQLAHDLNIKLGDVISFDIAGRVIKATVSNLRAVRWDSMHPNFYILFAPGIINTLPTTYITSFYVAPEHVKALNDLMAQFPNITLFDLSAIINQIQTILDKIILGIQTILGVALLAGILVIFAVIQVSLSSRTHEHAVLRTIGFTKHSIRMGLLIEFTVLGLISGVLASFGANLIAFVITRYLLHLYYTIHLWSWLIGPIASILINTTIGMWSTRNIVKSSPLTILRH